MENPNTPTPFGTPPEAARAGSVITLKDDNFIVLSKSGDPGKDGGFKPITYQDGTLVIYGGYEDAAADAAAGEIVVRALFPEGHRGADESMKQPIKAAADGISVEKSVLIAEALEITRRLWEIKNQLAPEDFTLDQTDTLACRLWLFQTDALGCWADYRTPNDIVERYDGKITRDQAFRALADCHSSEYLSDDIYRTVGDYVNDVINADKEGGVL